MFFCLILFCCCVFFGFLLSFIVFLFFFFFFQAEDGIRDGTVTGVQTCALPISLVGNPLPAGMAPKARPFAEKRIWSMGIVLAAQQLHFDLDHAEVDLPHGRITLRGPGGLERILPVDAEGYFYIDWCMPPNHPQLTEEAIQELLAQNSQRLQGHTNDLSARWAGKLVVVGSSALGNDLTDRGATPLGEDTLLVSKHWNVANSILTGRFVHRTPLWQELASIFAL